VRTLAGRGSQVKCRICGEKAYKDEMEQFEDVSGNFRYCHKGKCYEEKLANDKEMSEKDELNRVVREIHEIPPTIKTPSSYWLQVQDLRMGIFKKDGKVRKTTQAGREGFSYLLIAKVYIEYKNSIKQARKTKQFKSIEAEMNYCLAMVKSKIINFRNKQEKLAQRKAIEEQKSKLYAETQQDEPVTEEVKRPAKKHNGVDISRFLD
jgi:hypothetical protein